MPQWQVLWYAAQIREDEDDEAKYHKSLVEYLATLVSAEGGDRVRQIIEANERGDSKLKKDDNFEDTLNSVFGRAPDFEHDKARGADTDRAKHLTESDLDEVRVIRGKPTRGV